MSETAHKPWCTDHVETDPGEGYCRHAFWRGRVWETGEPEEWVLLVTDNGQTFLEVAPGSDNFVTPAEARSIAAALLEAADVFEAAGLHEAKTGPS